MTALEEFRTEVRSWLEKNCPPSQRRVPTREEQFWGGRRATFPNPDAKLWLERMVKQGWTVPDWPREYGGAGLNREQQRVLEEEMQRLKCRRPLYGHGIWMLGPVLLEYGSEEQKQEHLPPIAQGRVRWCQGFSEPGSGSDLASLRCRAEDLGDHYLVNGTKMWTSDGNLSDWIFCLTRTDPKAKKQEGISFLLIDMEDPGISTRPIELINGNSDFCQVFLDNVKVPKKNLLGKINQGWTVAKRLLQHERKLMSEAEREMQRRPRPMYEWARLYQPVVEGRLENPLLRDAVARHEMNKHSLELAQQRVQQEAAQGTVDGALISWFKYYGTELEKNRSELLITLMGEQGLGWEGEGFSPEELEQTRNMLSAKALTIAGGSSEIQLNIIAKRFLGLPDS